MVKRIGAIFVIEGGEFEMELLIITRAIKWSAPRKKGSLLGE